MSRSNFWSKLFGLRPATRPSRVVRQPRHRNAHERHRRMRQPLVENLEVRACPAAVDFFQEMGLVFTGGAAIAVDEEGNSYVAGQSGGYLPTTPGAYNTTGSGGEDCFVAKLDSGGQLIWATYLGGSGNDIAEGIALDSAHNVYLTGRTQSSDFPTTEGAFQTQLSGSSAFVAKLDATGSQLIYSTYLGGSGSNYGLSIAVDAVGNAYIGGGSTPGNFPTTPGAFQTDPTGGIAATVSKLNADGTALIYSTYLDGFASAGGSNLTGVYGIAVDSDGNAYVSGDTGARNFPTTDGAFRPTVPDGAGPWSFVAKLNPAGTGLIFSTYVGPEFQLIRFGLPVKTGGIAIDGLGNVYTAGSTLGGSFPTTPGALQTSSGGGIDTFVTKLDPTGSTLIYSTYLGGSFTDLCLGMGLDSAGEVYVTGVTNSAANFPQVNPVQPGFAASVFDSFIAKLDSGGTALVYSSYFVPARVNSIEPIIGAIAVDAGGNAYITGVAKQDVIPAFVAKITEQTQISIVSVQGGDFVYSGLPHGPNSSSVTSADGFEATPTLRYYVGGDTTGPGSPDAPINAGTYTVVASFAGDAVHTRGSASALIVIEPAPVAVSVTGGVFTYDGLPHGATSSSVTGPGGLSTVPTLAYYSGATLLSGPPTAPGSYTVVASYAGYANYNSGSASASIVILPKNLDATGSTENSINISKAGTITFELASVTGILAGDGTVYDLFNGATFQLRIGGPLGMLYSVSSTATVLGNGTVQISWRMTQELYNDLYAILGSATASNKTLVDLFVSGTSNDGNYILTEDVFSHIFQQGKVIFS